MLVSLLGIGLGLALRHINVSARHIKYLTFPGELMMRLLQMLILPLIISSLITGKIQSLFQVGLLFFFKGSSLSHWKNYTIIMR